MTGFSRSVSSFPREFPKRAEEVRGRSSSATCPYDTLCIYAQVDIGKSVQVGRLGTGSRDRGVFPARWEEFRDLNKCIGTSRHLDRQADPDQHVIHTLFRIIDRLVILTFLKMYLENIVTYVRRYQTTEYCNLILIWKYVNIW